jgi:hypothetical protein
VSRLLDDPIRTKLTLSPSRSHIEDLFDALNHQSPPTLSSHSTESSILRYEHASALSTYLIETYLTKADFHLEVIDWQKFGECFDRAGRRIDAMGPLGQVICHGRLIHFSHHMSSGQVTKVVNVKSPRLLEPG